MARDLYAEPSRFEKFLENTKSFFSMLLASKKKSALKILILSYWKNPTGISEAWNKVGYNRMSDKKTKEWVLKFFKEEFKKFFEEWIQHRDRKFNEIGQAFNSTWVSSQDANDFRKEIIWTLIVDKGEILWKIMLEYIETASTDKLSALLTEAKKTGRTSNSATTNWEPIIIEFIKRVPAFENLVPILTKKIETESNSLVEEVLAKKKKLPEAIKIFKQNGIGENNKNRLTEYFRNLTKEYLETKGTVLELDEIRGKLFELKTAGIVDEKFNFIEPATEKAVITMPHLTKLIEKVNEEEAAEATKIV